MIKKTVTFDDHSIPPKSITKNFYFNYTKLEVLEMMNEGLEAKINRLQETENAEEAYRIVKDVVLRGYGERTEDGGFSKIGPHGRPLAEAFASSEALSEIVFEMIADPKLGAKFIESMFPAKLVAEVRAENNVPEDSTISETVQAVEVQYPASPTSDPDSPMWDDFTEAQLLAMDQSQYDRLLPKDTKNWSREQLMMSFKRRSQS